MRVLNTFESVRAIKASYSDWAPGVAPCRVAARTSREKVTAEGGVLVTVRVRTPALGDGDGDGCLQVGPESPFGGVEGLVGGADVSFFRTLTVGYIGGRRLQADQLALYFGLPRSTGTVSRW